jgi:hypothetical protein
MSNGGPNNHALRQAIEESKKAHNKQVENQLKKNTQKVENNSVQQSYQDALAAFTPIMRNVELINSNPVISVPTNPEIRTCVLCAAAMDDLQNYYKRISVKKRGETITPATTTDEDLEDIKNDLLQIGYNLALAKFQSKTNTKSIEKMTETLAAMETLVGDAKYLIGENPKAFETNSVYTSLLPVQAELDNNQEELDIEWRTTFEALDAEKKKKNNAQGEAARVAMARGSANISSSQMFNTSTASVQTRGVGQTVGSSSGHTVGSSSGHTVGSSSGHTVGSSTGTTSNNNETPEQKRIRVAKERANAIEARLKKQKEATQGGKRKSKKAKKSKKRKTRHRV